MWKRILIYVIILIILLALYIFFTPQSLRSSSPSSGFKAPTGNPSVKGPTSQPPQQ